MVKSVYIIDNAVYLQFSIHNFIITNLLIGNMKLFVNNSILIESLFDPGQNVISEYSF